MNKQIFFFICIVFAYSPFARAQTVTGPLLIDDFKVLDTTRFTVRYSFSFTPDPSKPETKESDVVVLEIGTTISKSYSYGLFKHDSIFTYRKGVSSVPMFQKSVPPIEVFKNHPQGKNTVIVRAPGGRAPVFCYQDETSPKWQILPDRKQIAGYSCQKATTTFRGRVWEAWFTNQIPISDGPWKFQGLPGLVLEASDSQNHFEFLVIEIKQEKKPIKFFNWRCEKATRTDAYRYIKRYAERPVEVSKQRGLTLYMPGRTKAESLKVSFPFNPLELE